MCIIYCFLSAETTTPPTIISLPTNTSDVLRWTHTPANCSDYTYRYVLTWSRTDAANNPTSGNDTVTTQEYDFSSLPRGNYTVTITAQRVDYPFVRSEPVNMSISLIREFLYVCMCVCVCVCVCVCTVCVHMHVCVHMCVFMYVCLYMCCMHVHAYVSMYI